PGRDIETASTVEKTMAGALGRSGYNVPAILAALGGSENIVSLDNCITRLRLSVNDMSQVNVQALKDNRAIGVVQLNQHNLQVVIGPQVQSVKDEMEALMNSVQA
ncbi:glucose PTS transporter subunit EIIB, partial [Pseudescherichia sp.]